MSTFADRLQTLLEQRGMTQADLSRKCGLSRATLSRYLKGQFEAKQDSVYKIARATGVSEAWLMGADVPMERPSSSTTIPPGFAPPPVMHKVPLVGSIACGAPILADEHIEDYVDVPRHIAADFALTCKGDSMINAHIMSGDLVVVRPQQNADDGQIVVARIEDEATVKRLRRRNGQIWLLPENDNYDPIDGTHAEIIGIVKALVREY